KPEIKLIPIAARCSPAQFDFISGRRHGNPHDQGNSGIAAVDTRQLAETTEQVLERRSGSSTPFPETVFRLPDWFRRCTWVHPLGNNVKPVNCGQAVHLWLVLHNIY